MTSIDDYSRASFELRCKEQIASILENPLVVPSDCPRAILLGGQSGAGKTTLHLVYKEQLEGNAIVINGDEYRKLHPNFAEIQERYGVEAPTHTAAWSGAMVEALIDAFSLQGYNLVVEGTLRTSEVPLKTATLLRERGYSVSLAIMAVKPEITLISCQIRYEMMRIAGTTPRAVDPEHHASIVKDIVSNLAALDGSGLFDRIELYSRAGACLLGADCPTGDPGASAVLADTLFGEWTSEELAHYNRLRERLGELQA